MSGGKLAASLTALVLAMSSTALAQEPLPLTVKDVKPALKPSGSPRFYPEVAQRAGVEGRATALCDIAKNGDLINCTVSDETPQGCQFGAAVVKLATAMRVPRRLEDGTPTAGRRYQFDLKFKLPNDMPVRATSC
ncbi:TonB family protein [Phenylobacterium sp. VNQ135]|uniref:TonB family protein n=1 Tax=Phenylobacterium sp. VNQ135 TaxID=3400922 RepID=UPI003C0BEDE1